MMKAIFTKRAPAGGARPRNRGRRRAACIAGIVFALTAALPVRARDAWRVEDAPLRFTARITAQPSDTRAGVVVMLPDGGLLPRPVPEALVVDASGGVFPAECVWHNPREGFAAVFAAPRRATEVAIYVRGSERGHFHTPSSDLKPGLMVYAQPLPPAAVNLEAVRRLASAAPPGRDARFGFVDFIHARRNPLWRREENYVSYYSGWLKPRRPGPTWIASISLTGGQVLVDGRSVTTWPAGTPRREGARGQFGGTVDFSGDIHRLQYLHYQRTGTAETLLAWRLPGTASEELPDVLRKNDFLHSGRAEPVAAEFRNGAPAPLISIERLNHLWMFDDPVYLVKCALTDFDRHPDDTAYTWRIGDGPEIKAREFHWLVEGDQERPVRLAAASAKGTTTVTMPFYLRETTRSASVNNHAHRRRYREAFLEMCRLLPPDASPAAHWSANMWNTLLEVLEPYAGADLLLEIFERSREDILNMPANRRRRLEDLFFETIRYTDRAAAAEWLKRLHDEERDRRRRLDWQLVNVDFLLYDLGDTNAALRIVRGLQTASGDQEVSIRAAIRMGDIERLAGNHEEAARIYSRAQDRGVELRRRRATLQTQESAMSLQRGADAIRAAQEQRQAISLRQLRAGAFRADDWRVMAVRGSVHYEKVRNLIRTGFLFEARDALAEWELEFPLHKIAEDLVIAEAEYHMTIDNHARAALLLANYRAGVSMSNFLPLAMQMELECLLRLERHDALRALAEDIEERLPNHPVAGKAREALATLGG